MSIFRVRFVRIFKLIGLLSMVCAQDLTIKSIDSLVVVDSLNQLVAENSLEYSLKSFNHHSTTYSVHSIQITPNNVNIIGLEMCTDIFQSRLTQPLRDGVHTPESLTKIANQIRNQYHFIRQTPKIVFGRVNSDNLGAHITFEPQFRSHFSGLVGADKSGENWQYNGEIDFGLENIFRRGESVGIQWNRRDSLSQQINLYWEEPHPFGWSLGASFSWDYELFNGLFIQSIQKGYIQLYPDGSQQIKIGYIQGKTHITNKGANFDYKSDSFGALSIQLFSDTAHRRFLPRQGHLLNIEFNLGIRDKDVYSTSKVEVKKRFPISNKFHSMLSYLSQGISGHGQLIPKSHYIRYGGVNSIRGFENNEFSSTQMQLISVESNFQANPQLALTSFMDFSTNNINVLKPSHRSYGVGLKQLQGNIELSLSYAIPWGDPISSGKLHVKWVSRL